MDLLVTVLYFLVAVAFLVLAVYIVTWVLGQLGIAIPAHIMKVVWIIVALLIILWLLQALLGGGLVLPRLSIQ